MSDLYELLAPYFDGPEAASSTLASPAANDPLTKNYLARLSTLSLSDLTSNEPASLQQSLQSHLRNLQALSKRSHKVVIESSAHLDNLSSLLPTLQNQARELQDDTPQLESAAGAFMEKYDRSTENAVLDRRKRAMLLSRNMDRVSDVLDMPTLLSCTILAAKAAPTTSASTTATSYASALDLHAHIKRLTTLYPQSELVGSISKQAEAEIRNLMTILITSLQNPALKLAAAMRTVGWLRRVAPELVDAGSNHRPGARSAKAFDVSINTASDDGALGPLFLVCRLRMLNTMFEALEPLRELADQETARRQQITPGPPTKPPNLGSAIGSQSERYLKRYIEIFREQSFGIINMYKSMFPSGLPVPEGRSDRDTSSTDQPLLPLPSPVASFVLHLIDMFTAVLGEYMPNITDPSARESLMTQVLYCASSLGRLGADFGMAVALLDAEHARVAGAAEDEAEDDPEWVQVMKKHRVQAGRLEVLARGVGGGRREATKGSAPSSAGVSAG